MQIRHVTTAFLQRADGKILLGKRSSDVNTYPGKWAAISGSVEEESPPERARIEVEEETGISGKDLHDAVRGLAVRFPAWDIDIFWVVHPFLYECHNPESVRRDWEHVQFEWVEPETLNEIPTVPKLVDAWTSVARAAESSGERRSESIFQTVENDTEHGAEQLGLWTLAGLRAAVSEIGPQIQKDMRPVCRLAAQLRPSMATPQTAALNVWEVIQENSSKNVQGKKGLVQALDRLIHQREKALLLAGEKAGERIPEGSHVISLSYSSSVLLALSAARRKIKALTVAESRPECEGRELARAAAGFGIETSLVTDAAACSATTRADVVLCGADSLLSGGSFANKIGTFALCAAARLKNIRTFAVATTSKLTPAGFEPELQKGPEDQIGPAPQNVRLDNPIFERVPAEVVTEIIVESGVISGKKMIRETNQLGKLREELFS
ncbi:MAG: NUDIX domain-containing protein [Candidatus Brocadiia bacterium]